MQSSICQPDPNLIAETYRKHVVELPMRFEKHFDFIEVNIDGIFLMGTSNLTGRIWSGSLWIFDDPGHPPDVEKCIAGKEFDSGISVGKWFENGLKIVVGTDSGAIHFLAINSMTDINKQYLTTTGIFSEHDDIISALDVTSNSKKLISGSYDMNIKIWDAEDIICEKTYECAHAHAVTSVCFETGKDDIFMSTSLDGTCLMWDTRVSEPASLLMKTDSGYTTSCWVDSNTVVLGANCGSVSLVDLRMKAELDRNFCSKRPMYRTVYNDKSEFLAVCADDPTVRIFDCSKKILKNIYECERHKDFIRGLAWQSSNILYSCGWDSKIYSHTIPTDVKEQDESDGTSAVSYGNEEAEKELHESNSNE